MPNVLIYRTLPAAPTARSIAGARDWRARTRAAVRTPWWVVIALLLAALLLAAPNLANSQDTAKNTNPFAGNPEAIHEGRALYIKNGCSGCHGVMGGGGMAVALIDDNWKFGDSDEILFKLIKGEIPESTMPKLWGALPADDVWKMLAYIRSLRSEADKGAR